MVKISENVISQNIIAYNNTIPRNKMEFLKSLRKRNLFTKN